MSLRTFAGRAVTIPRLVILAWLAVAPGAPAAPDIFRTWFTPTVVPTNFAGPVRFEAEITGGPTSVVFTNNTGINRQMFDDGTNGDLVAGDGVWTCLFTTAEVFSRNATNRIFRPHLGSCVPTNSGAFNTIAEVWTPQIGLVPVRTNLAQTNQSTDYVVNYVATRAQLTNFNAQYWSARFVTNFGDKYDFLNFVHIAGVRGNRYHAGVKNTTLGISSGTYSNNASFGSAGRLQGYTVFPIPSFFDGGSPTYSHETGHQWINFLANTPYSNGIPHWPKGDVAINVMGFSIPGSGAGGNYNYTFTRDGSGNYTASFANPTNISTFNLLELYLMGFAAPAEVGTNFVLNDQNLNVTNGQVLTPAEITLVTVGGVIAARGARVPDSGTAQRVFRSATILLSEQFLDPYAMSLYDFFARRIEAKTPLAYADGLATGTSNPWFLATGRRSVMYAKIADERPFTSPVKTNADVRYEFTGRPGIRYQPQVSFNLTNWVNDGSVITIPTNGFGDDVATNFLRTPATGTNRAVQRLNVFYWEDFPGSVPGVGSPSVTRPGGALAP